MQTATREITLLLRDRHGIVPGDEADFEVHSSEEISEFMGTIWDDAEMQSDLARTLVEVLQTTGEVDVVFHRTRVHGLR